MSAVPLPLPPLGAPTPDRPDRGAIPEHLRPPEASPRADPGHDRHFARRTLLAAVVIGAAGDLLLRAGVPTPGLNVLLTTLLGLGGLGWLARRQGRPLTVGAAAVAALALAFAAAITVRDSGALLALDLLALGTTACALAVLVRQGPAVGVDAATMADYGRAAVRTLAGVAGGPRPMVRPALPPPHAAGPRLRRVVGVGVRGAVLAVPALAGFGALLTAADERFATVFASILGWDVQTPVTHLLGTVAFAWGTAGYLYAALRTPDASSDAPTRRGRWLPALTGALEWCVALVLVDLLFVAFGVVQLGWLFGGRALVASSATTYAAYARRGFFELVWTAALALPAALGAYRAGMRALTTAPPNPEAVPAVASDATRRALRIAATTLVAGVGVVLVSAADRMRLYEAAYGLTELRFYASAFMVWLAVIAAGALATILRDRPAPFALGALTTAWLWVLTLNVVNPDARIVATNAAHAAVGGSAFDVDYASSLSADAAPALLATITAGSVRLDASACQVARTVTAWRTPDPDWRAWNASRRQAARLATAAATTPRMRAWTADCERQGSSRDPQAAR